MIFEKYPLPCFFFFLFFFFMKSIISGVPNVLFSVMVPFNEDHVLGREYDLLAVNSFL